jgi:hypothetical protein
VRTYYSAFEIASRALREKLRYLHRELKMPIETIRLQVDGILHSFAVEDLYEKDKLKNETDPK